MTSGLRSVRDKTLTYFEDELATRSEPFQRLFKTVNTLAGHLREVTREDKAALVDSGFKFDFYALVGGQLEHDREHLLYLVYPEGNWVEIGKGTPYQIIGSPAYGKPVLDRTLQYKDSLRFALKVGVLSFDSTRISAADVDYPMDVVIYAKNTYQITEHRYSKDDLAPISDWWQDRLRNSVRDLSAEWIDRVFTNVLPTADTRM
jgi:putative proteasome-type protease